MQRIADEANAVTLVLLRGTEQVSRRGCQPEVQHPSLAVGKTRAVTLRTDRTPVAQVGACVGARRLRRAGLGQSPVAGLMAPAILDPHQVANLQVRPYRLPARRLFRGP